MSRRTSIVILNWNGRQLLENFLPALVRNTPSDIAEIVVADNGSSDDSVTFLEKNYPFIRLIKFNINYGFAGGYNRALSEIDNDYVILLNSDVEVTPDWLTAPIEYLDANPDIVAVQPKILSYNNKTRFEYAGAAGGYLDMYGYPFCRGRIFTRLEKDDGQYNKPAEILWASGACMFIRCKDYFECGGLDEYFFAHQEEIDMCWRLRARGKKIVCLPQSTVYHVGGATLNTEHPQKTFLNFRNNLLLLYKNLPEQYFIRVFLFRFFADYLAALRFLFKGRPVNAWAVVKARWKFQRKKKDYREIRRTNMQKSVCQDLPNGIIKKSLLVNYSIIVSTPDFAIWENSFTFANNK
ncbi:MAG: glycosyltransferase family 2 protein [Dysgonamonadaceae bacterium]|jgi:GT2 family glycosyltransferase|nr:glycosyltransferase family 2 protein [Dysgonamonadaceae bacterium]